MGVERAAATIGALLASVARRFVPQWVASAMSTTNEAVGEVLPDDAEVPVPQDSDDSADSDDEADPEEFSGDRLTDQIIREGTALKEAATALFKEKKFDEAINKYREGFDAVPGDISGYRSGVAHELRIACLNNAAMCQVKIEAWDAVISTCSETIEIDSKSVKAWYRRGLANQKLQDWDHAKSDLRTALEIEPKNKDVAKQMESCQKEQMATKKQKGGLNDYSRFDQKDSKYWWDNRGGQNASSTGSITPQKITSPEQVTASNLQAGASQWNSAGTWEEKNMSDWFENQLKSALSSISFDQDGAEASITSVEGFSGDVNICKRRNKTSWIYDVNFKVKFEIDGQKGTLTIPELGNMDDDDYCIELKWASSAKKRGAVEGVLNIRGQRGATGLVPRVRDAIAQVSEDFLKQ